MIQKKTIWTLVTGLACCMLAITSCNEDVKFEDNPVDYAASIIRSFTANEKVASIDHTNAAITLTLPAGTDMSQVAVEMTLPEGATVDPTSGSVLDFTSGEQTFLVTNENVSRTYTANISAFGTPLMQSFAIGTATGTIDQSTGRIDIRMGSTENLYSVAPLFIIPAGTTASPQSGIEQNFATPVKYTILSNDGYTGKTYTVYATQIAKPEITSFKGEVNGSSYSGVIDNEASTVVLNVPAGTDITAFSPVIVLAEGCTVSPSSQEAQDFSAGPVNYTVTNEEGLTKVYAVTVQEKESTERVAFISGAAEMDNISEPDTKAAAQWLMNNYPDDFVYLQASALTAEDLSQTEVLLFYWDNTDTTAMPDGGLDADKLQIIIDYYKAGGHMIIEGFAINTLDDIARININGTIFQNEGGYTGAANQNGDAWGINLTYDGAPDATLNHPVIAGLSQGDTDYYPMNDAGYKEDRNMGIDFGWAEYNGLFTTDQCSEARALEFESLTNCVLIRWYEWLGARGCGIGIAEFKPQGDFQGTMILNTGGWLEWSMEDNNGAINNYHSNIERFHQNAVDYLLGL